MSIFKNFSSKKKSYEKVIDDEDDNSSSSPKRSFDNESSMRRGNSISSNIRMNSASGTSTKSETMKPSDVLKELFTLPVKPKFSIRNRDGKRIFLISMMPIGLQ